MNNKPFASACERNREPILAVLRRWFADRSRVLEIGSGSGQHAVYFAAALPHLRWQTSDKGADHIGIQAWLDEAALPNLPPPLTLDVAGEWPDDRYDAVFSANTLHIMGWREVQALFMNLPRVMTIDAKLVIYGPFHYDGKPTSVGNARFDEVLRAQRGDMGIRDMAAVNALARHAGLRLLDDIAMPANNRCLVWQRLMIAGEHDTDAGTERPKAS